MITAGRIAIAPKMIGAAFARPLRPIPNVVRKLWPISERIAWARPRRGPS